MTVESYFAQWQKTPRSRWTATHWFRPDPKCRQLSTPACGVMPPRGVHGFSLPPEPILTCRTCIKAIKRRDAE